MYKECCSTYESASLRMFRLGRTETIRSTTNDSFAFVKAMDDPAKQVSPLSFYPLSCVFVGMCEKVCVCVCVHVSVYQCVRERLCVDTPDLFPVFGAVCVGRTQRKFPFWTRP